MKSSTSGYLGIVSTVPKKIKGEFNLWHKTVPFFGRECRISTTKRSNEVGFIGLYCSESVVGPVGIQCYVSTGLVSRIEKLHCQEYGLLVDDRKIPVVSAFS